MAPLPGIIETVDKFRGVPFFSLSPDWISFRIKSIEFTLLLKFNWLRTVSFLSGWHNFDTLGRSIWTYVTNAQGMYDQTKNDLKLTLKLSSIQIDFLKSFYKNSESASSETSIELTLSQRITKSISLLISHRSICHFFNNCNRTKVVLVLKKELSRYYFLLWKIWIT